MRKDVFCSANKLGNNMNSNLSETEYQRERKELHGDLLNSTRDAEYSSWNALLTFNAIVISVFSVASIVTEGNRWPIFVLIVCCLISSACLIINFVTRREGILRQYETIMQDDSKIGPEQILKLKRELVRTKRTFSNIRLREKIAQYILIPEALIIVWLLLGKPTW
jgi:hypothetical protein